MARITFQKSNNVFAYLSMAEGMWENARHDNEGRRAKEIDGVIKLIQTQQGNISFPWTIELPAELRNVAQDVLDNCLDNSTDEDDDSADTEDFIFAGQVEITD